MMALNPYHALHLVQEMREDETIDAACGVYEERITELAQEVERLKGLCGARHVCWFCGEQDHTYEQHMDWLNGPGKSFPRDELKWEPKEASECSRG